MPKALYTIYFMPDKIKAVFLDRDGVLNKEMGDYVCRLEDFHVLDNFDALKELQNRGYMLLVAICLIHSFIRFFNDAGNNEITKFSYFYKIHINFFKFIKTMLLFR